MNKSTHPFLQLLVMCAVSLALLGFSSVLMFFVALVGIDITAPSSLLTLQAISQLLSFVLPVLLVVWLYHRDEPRPFMMLEFGRNKWLLALAGLAAWALFMPLMDWTGVWNDNWHWSGPFEALERLLRQLGESTSGIMMKFFGQATVGSLIANLIVIALVPAVSEELFFRAGMQNLMVRWVKNPHLAIWITAAVFSIVHGEVFAFLPRFVMGGILGYLYFGSKSLLPNMVAHFFNNALVVVTYWLSARGVIAVDLEAPMAAPWPVTLGCTVAAVAVLYVSFGKNLKISR